jgi:hypothetical protein
MPGFPNNFFGVLMYPPYRASGLANERSAVSGFHTVDVAINYVITIGGL